MPLPRQLNPQLLTFQASVPHGEFVPKAAVSRCNKKASTFHSINLLGLPEYVGLGNLLSVLTAST